MRVLAVLGKLLISLGVGVLLFVAWTLWGTGLYTEREQTRLSQTFDAQPSFKRVVESGDRPHGPPADFRPGPGDPVFRLEIPALDIRKIVVEGSAWRSSRWVPVTIRRAGDPSCPHCAPNWTKSGRGNAGE